ncbi:Uncharacterised protein [Klebsiella pneumoniae]|nr:Uncharacterised protein [Klebsiella pneumoniae]
MARTIFHKGDEIGKLADVARLLLYDFIENGADSTYYINILTFVMAANVVSFTALALGGDFIKCTRVIFHIEPVTNLFAVAIHRQRFTRQRIENGQRDQFFREVIRAIVIGAVGHHDRQTVGTVPGTNQVIATGLGGRVRAAWRIRRFFRKQVISAVQVTINFISRDMVETERLLLRGIQGRVIVTCRLQQGKGADQVSLNKGCRTIN